MTRTFNRIVAYGCSWTAGTELMDHVHMGVSFEECNAIKETYISKGNPHENVHKFIEKYNINNKSLDELNRRSSWAGQLASLLSKPIDHRAEVGAGIDHIYFKLYNDLITGKILDTDLVLVGITSPHRTINFGKHSVGSFQLGHHFRKATEDNLLIEMFNDDYLIFIYFKTLQLFGALHDKINIRLQPVIRDVYPHRTETFIYDLNYTRPYAVKVWYDLQNIFLLEEEYLHDCIVDGKLKRCGFLHEPVESHIELANKIYNQVKF
jgi:hypothetical protein